jgi:hypothetical protein
MTPDELAKAVYNAEREERIARGLPPNHLTDWSHFPFKFAEAAVAEFDRVTAKAFAKEKRSVLYLFRVMAALMKSDYAAANALAEEWQAFAPHDPKAAMRFGLAPLPAEVELPPVIGALPSHPCLLIACDRKYFRWFGIVLLRSIARTSPDAPVHVHFLDADTSDIAKVETLPLRLTYSAEDSAPFIAALGVKPSDYYGSARLIRFAEALAANPGPLWSCDVDSLVTADIRPLFTEVEGDAMFRVRAGRLEPWNQFSACLFMGSAASRPYFDRVAAILRANLHAPWWGIDQFALFSAWIGLKPAIGLLGPADAAVDLAVPGRFWFTAGMKRNYLGVDGSPYSQTYRSYVAPAEIPDIIPNMGSPPAH